MTRAAQMRERAEPVGDRVVGARGGWGPDKVARATRLSPVGLGRPLPGAISLS